MKIIKSQDKTFDIFRMILQVILFITLISLNECKKPTIQLTPLNHYIVLYPGNSIKGPQKSIKDIPEKLYFKTDFTSTEFIYDKKFKDTCLYLDNHPKTRTQNKCLTKYMKIKFQEITLHNSQPDQDDQAESSSLIHGIIGMKNNSEFIKAIKQSLGWKQIKFNFKIYENKIDLLDQKCNNPQFPPHKLFLRNNNNRIQQTLTHLSLNFNPQPKRFLKLFKANSNPFTLSRNQLTQKIQIEVYNQIQHIPIKTLFDDLCLSVVGTHNYQCDLAKKPSKQIYIKGNPLKKDNDIGLLLAEYQPVLCADIDALQFLQQNHVDSELYYWSHILLVLLQFGALLLYTKRQLWKPYIFSFFNRNSYHQRNY